MKLLIGGSPCTHWSIAQTKNRETEPSGLGWELFKNYLIAREKYKPDYFLYENNKSMSAAIRAQITKELGVEPVLINSALVSAQNRQRLYWVGKRMPDGTYAPLDIQQPEDRGILLRDILETGYPLREKSYALLSVAHSATAEDAIARRQRNAAAEPVEYSPLHSCNVVVTDQNIHCSYKDGSGTAQGYTVAFDDVKSQTVTAGHAHKMKVITEVKPLTEREMEYMVRETKDGRNHFDFDYHHDTTKDKSSCITANVHRGVPYNVCCECVNSNPTEPAGINRLGGLYGQHTRWGIYDPDGKVPRITASAGMGGGHLPMWPERIGTIENQAKNPEHDSQQYRVYSPDAKSATLCGAGGGIGAKTGLYAVPLRGGCLSTQPLTEKLNACEQPTIRTVSETWLETPLIEKPVLPCVSAPDMRVREATKLGYVDVPPGECVDLSMPNSKTRRGRAMKNKSNCLTTSCEFYEYCGTLDAPVYQVKDGKITVKGKEYPIKLRDGCYIIRKLTVTECKRLQTVPDEYIFPVSDSQAYKMLGNGWTVDVIAHIMSHFQGLTEEPVEVLSMYDGMSCGHIALDKLGAQISRYHATEIDKYAIQTTQENYPDTVQLGDAFAVREDDWTGGGLIAADQGDTE